MLHKVEVQLNIVYELFGLLQEGVSKSLSKIIWLEVVYYYTQNFENWRDNVRFSSIKQLARTKELLFTESPKNIYFFLVASAFRSLGHLF